MPLPNIKKQCTAIKRKTGERCKNPAAWDCKTCRSHGARRPSSIKKGVDHPQYLHGGCTMEAREACREGMSRLRELEDLAFKHGVLSGKRTMRRRHKAGPGAEPTANKTERANNAPKVEGPLPSRYRWIDELVHKATGGTIESLLKAEPDAN